MESGFSRAFSDYLALTRPRVVLMVLVTTFVGFYLGSLKVLNWSRLLQTLIGTALAAGGTLAHDVRQQNRNVLMAVSRCLIRLPLMARG
jgi:protoheme IX farnesyltransferase